VRERERARERVKERDGERGKPKGERDYIESDRAEEWAEGGCEIKLNSN
jgi:hypothetical protein